MEEAVAAPLPRPAIIRDHRPTGRPKGGPKFGGWKKGTKNKIVPEVKKLAQEYGAEARRDHADR